MSANAATSFAAQPRARTLYRTLLGPAFDRLPAPIREMHALARRATGTADIVRGTGPLARLICAVARVPRTGRGVPVETTFEPIAGGERWTRRFNGEAFATDMLIDDTGDEPRLAERFGPFLFRLRMIAGESGTDLIPEAVSLWGATLPKFFAPRAIGRERVKDGLYHFDVVVRFPIAGEVLRYEGVITPDLTGQG